MDQRLREAVAAQTNFSFELSLHFLNNILGSTTYNLLYSPLCIHSFMGLLTASCTGATHRQLLECLGCRDTSHLTALFSHLSNGLCLLADRSSVGGPHLHYTGGVWANARMKDSFRDIANLVYKVPADTLPFSIGPELCNNEIDLWVQQETAGFIRNLFPPESITRDTRLVLGNAIHFKGSWDAKLTPWITKTDNFLLLNGSSVKTPFMTSKQTQFVSAYDGFKVLMLPYEQGQDWRKFSFYIFLPDKLHSLRDLTVKLSAQSDFVNHYMPEKRVPVGIFRIPKFKICMGSKFAEILSMLRLDLPFKKTGDFSEIVDSSDARNCSVSEIVTRCVLEVDEGRNQAAAAPGAMAPFEITGLINEPIDFVADHPFMFLIREEKTGVVYYVGNLLNPCC